MNIILYTAASDPLGERLTELIAQLVPEGHREIYQTMHHFSNRLRHPTYKPFIAVLLVPNHDELLKIYHFRHLLQDHRIILVLPDRKDETLAIAHRLRPRFLSDINGNLEEIVAVLGKMMAENGPRPYAPD